MAFRPTTTKQIAQNAGIKMLVHGPAGAGKTRLCATTGALDKTLIISCEAGLLSLREFDIAVAEIKSLQELKEVFDFLCNEQHDFSWVCLDSISEIAEVVLSEDKKTNKDPRAAYGSTSDKMLGIIRAFRDLPLNVFFTAKQQSPSEDVKYFRASMPGKGLTDSLPYLFDEVFALRVEQSDEGPVRSLQTVFDGRYYAKDRSGSLAHFEPADLSHIVAKML